MDIYDGYVARVGRRSAALQQLLMMHHEPIWSRRMGGTHTHTHSGSGSGSERAASRMNDWLVGWLDSLPLRSMFGSADYPRNGFVHHTID